MADLTTANLISYVSPARYETGVATNGSIQVGFLRDMDQHGFSQATIALELVGTVIRIPFTFAYADRVLTISPTTALTPNSSYKITLVGDVNPQTDVLTSNITGIRDIVGNGMIGEWTSYFTTGVAGASASPAILSPIDESAILNQPLLIWTAVAGASGYNVQVSKDNTFENIYWPTPTTSWNQTNTSVTPDLPFDYNQEYWWRVRAYVGNTPGAWSAPANFYYGNPTYGSVTPDDIPLGLVPPTADLVQVLSTNPAPNQDNILPSDYPNAITIVLSGSIEQSNVTPETFWVDSEPVDGEFEYFDFRPIFSPSLNGNQFGGGGITAPAPVDSYQQILPSGKLQEDPSAISVEYDSVANKTTIKLNLSAGYLQDNNVYTVHFNIPELNNPIKWTFSSRWFPVFSSAKSVRRMVDHYLPELTDQEIWATIRKNSLNAIFLQTYPPTQVDGDSWIYNPPVSFNIQNPPFFVREYARIQTGLDFLRDLLHQAIRGGKTTLGDFTVDQESAATKGMLELAIARLEKEIAPFLDKLHGHTNRGYARGDWALRGEQGGYNPLRERPFGLSRKGPSFIW